MLGIIEDEVYDVESKPMYDFIASFFGDNEKSKRIYRYSRLFIVLILYMFAVLYADFKMIQDYHPTLITIAVIDLILTLVWAFSARRILKDKMENLHMSPDLKKLDLKGGRLTLINLNGENILRIEYKNYFAIKVSFKDNTYFTGIENEVWEIVKETQSKDRTELRQAMTEAIEYASAQKLPDEEPDI